MEMWVQLSAGEGPEECGRALWHISQEFEKELKKLDVRIELLKAETAKKPRCFRSMLFKVSGENLESLKEDWQGPICWKAPSPFRAHYKRQNWFIQLHFLGTTQREDIDLKLVKFEAVKASGAGGQHVNKTSTAIRATYEPLKLSVFCQDERSQVRNKELALARLLKLIEDRRHKQKKQDKQEQRLMHYSLERGNPVRTFRGKL